DLGFGGVVRPVLGHALVGDAAEHEQVELLPEAEAQLAELLSPDVLVELEVPLLGSLEVPVQRDDVPDDELAHDVLQLHSAIGFEGFCIPTSCDWQAEWGDERTCDGPFRVPDQPDPRGPG